MAERILIGVAWPYANGSLHVGQIAGAYMPADIFARFHRMNGNEVLMVSGSDQHGTPITVRADQENVDPQTIIDRYHSEFCDNWERLGISFDLFTTTGTQNHKDTVQGIFLTLLEKGFIYPGTQVLPYCPTDERYLPDRYVNGTCPHCGFTQARGDQCDNCSRPLDPVNLIDPLCSLDGTSPDFREREHHFLKLSAFGDQLSKWYEDKSYWRQNVRNFTTNFVEQGLIDRAITRDISWGISVPVEDYDDRRIYVWFEAVIGYLSASKEWAQTQGMPDKWKEFWTETCKSYYFIGKDNIPFHTIIWPAILMGYENLNLPYDVPANEYMNLEGQKISTSRNWAVWLPDYLDSYDPDPLRYYLSATMPETSDSGFSWSGFVERNNNELVGNYGNLVHRVLSLTQRHFDGQCPDPADELDSRSKDLIQLAENCFDRAGGYLGEAHFRMALNENMGLAREVNRYLEEKAPWKTAREDLKETGKTLYTALVVISSLRILMYPFLPFTSQRLHEMMGFDGLVEDIGWQPNSVQVNQQMLPPTPLFQKLDEQEVVERETLRLNQTSQG